MKCQTNKMILFQVVVFFFYLVNFKQKKNTRGPLYFWLLFLTCVNYTSSKDYHYQLQWISLFSSVTMAGNKIGISSICCKQINSIRSQSQFKTCTYLVKHVFLSINVSKSECDVCVFERNGRDGGEWNGVWAEGCGLCRSRI